jgi:hypothetical protein
MLDVSAEPAIWNNNKKKKTTMLLSDFLVSFEDPKTVES